MNAPAIRRLLPLLAAVAVLAVVVGAVALGRDTRSGEKGLAPPGGAVGDGLLRLDGYVEPDQAATPDSRFHLAADLPAGPSRGAIQHLGSPAADDVMALAAALGMAGQIDSSPDRTTYTTPAATLTVSTQDGAWRYGRRAFTGDQEPMDCRRMTGTAPDDPDGTVSSCGPATDALPATSEQDARRVASPVLDATGVAADDATVETAGGGAQVAGEPVVDDLPTEGIPTSLLVAGDAVASGSGWLTATRPGGTYPLITAQQAWDQLVRTPMAMPAIGCPTATPEHPTDPLLCGGPITVTGVRYGLALEQSQGDGLLVPAWLFDVRDSSRTLSVVAVDPEHVAATSQSSDGGTGGGSGGSEPGSPGTSVPPSVPPPVGTEPMVDSRFSDVHEVEGGNLLAVTFTGGVADCYAYAVAATENPTEVRLTLAEKVTTDKPCDEMAQVYQRRVPLASPLGTRRVVDARTGAVLLPSGR